MAVAALAASALRSSLTLLMREFYLHGGIASGEGEFRMETTVGPLVRIPTKGTRIAMDGDVPLLTPYDDCYLIMPPSGGNAPKKGARTVRLARPAPTPRL